MPPPLRSQRFLWQCPATMSGESFRVRRRSGASMVVRCALRRVGRCVSLVAPLGLAACAGGVLDPKGTIGHENRIILIDSMAIMLAIVIPTIVATFAFAWWFRASNKRATYLPDWEFSGRIEMIVWAIPAMTIILLGGVTWIGSHELDPAKPIESKTAALDIQVVSLDWKWLFIYPEQRIASVNELVVPVGTPLHFTLTSASVMNTFFVPQLGSMIYTMNGMQTELWLHADEPGDLRGISGHYSGEGFSDMHFNVRALPAEKFAGWVNTTRDAGSELDSARYNELAKQSIAVPVARFGHTEKDLFAKIVALELQPGPGPGTERGGVAQKAEIKQ